MKYNWMKKNVLLKGLERFFVGIILFQAEFWAFIIWLGMFWCKSGWMSLKWLKTVKEGVEVVEWNIVHSKEAHTNEKEEEWEKNVWLCFLPFNHLAVRNHKRNGVEFWKLLEADWVVHKFEIRENKSTDSEYFNKPFIKWCDVRCAQNKDNTASYRWK